MDLFDNIPDVQGAATQTSVWYPAPNDVMSQVAARRLGKPGWAWCKSSVVGRPPHGAPRNEVHFLLEGAVPVGVVTRGKNKGRAKWPKVLDQIVITGAEYDAEVLAVEDETKKCHPCSGTGRTIASVQTMPLPVTYTYQTCSRCHGSGRPKARPEVAC